MVRPVHLWLALTFGTCAAALGCATETLPPAAVASAPAPLPEFASTPPAPGMLWVAGCWHWDGSGYLWLPGHWESPARAATE